MKPATTVRPIEYSSILVPTDFTPVGDTAIQHATKLAIIFQKDISLLHVVESGMLDSSKRVNEKEDNAIEKLQQIANKIKSESGINVTYFAPRGNIFDTIGEVAQEINTGLVVMGTHGLLGTQKLFGSRALKVINNTGKPFVVVHKKSMKDHGYKNIVLPIDFSKESKQKLVWAVELNKKFNSVFHILAEFESDEYAARAVNNNIAWAEHYLKERDCSYTVKKSEKGENFAKATIQFAASIDADLIIIMTNQDRAMDVFVLGPYEQTVVANDAQIPVLTLNPVDNMKIVGKTHPGAWI